MACSVHSTGPLSSVEPRPNRRPSFSVSSKGSVSHPSSYTKLKLLPPANEVWSKVMFSHACVKNSVDGRGVSQYALGMGVSAPPKADNPPPRETATAADGTHATGMHCCFI